MPNFRPANLTASDWFALAPLLEQTAVRIGRLDGRVINSLSRYVWHQRAVVLGYAQALQLQGVATDAKQLFQDENRPETILKRGEKRAGKASTFRTWRALIRRDRGAEWFDLHDLKRPSVQANTLLLLIIGYYDMAEKDSLLAALSWPFMLRRAGITKTCLGCLVTGTRATGSQSKLQITRMLERLGNQAGEGERMLDQLEATHHQFAAALAGVRKPQGLIRLASILMAEPVVRPAVIAQRLNLSLSATGRLLEQARQLGLVDEITDNRTWRRYVAKDIAIEIDVAPAIGRPRKPAMPELEKADYRGIYLELAKSLADVDRLLGLENDDIT